MKNRRAMFLASLVLMLCFSSCEKYLGYGVLLWSIPERGLMDGDVLRVCIKSNIAGVWVAEKMESTQSNKDRFEVPLWMLNAPLSKKKADEIKASYEEYRGCYAKVMLDALPIRSSPTNASKRVYRLREGEVIHILRAYQPSDGKCEVPVSGNEALKGIWLWVITQDGTQGWCFSHSLRLGIGEDSDGNGGEI